MLDHINPSDWDDAPEKTTMQITVQFVNQPSKNPKFGSIKATNGNYYDISAEALYKYRNGMTFDAPVKEREYKGKTYYSIPDSFNPTAGPPLDPTPNGHANTTPPRTATPTNGSAPFRDPRQMFLCEVVSRAMGSGTFNAADIEPLTLAAAAAWDLHG